MVRRCNERLQSRLAVALAEPLVHSDILQYLHDVGHYSRGRLCISFGWRNWTGSLHGIAGFDRSFSYKNDVSLLRYSFVDTHTHLRGTVPNFPL